MSENPLSVYDYKNKDNMVAVISNRNAVSELDNLGALGAKPQWKEQFFYLVYRLLGLLTKNSQINSNI